MIGWKKHLSSALAVAVLAIFSAGCSDGADSAADKQPIPLTKEDLKEAVRDGVHEASRPGQFTYTDEDRARVREQMKGYSAEDEERKRVEAQKKYEELQQKKEREKANRESDR